MQVEILDFIHRRFQENCHWMDGNCYYFAMILLERFPLGRVVYDPIDGHFLFEMKGHYYDWEGEKILSEKPVNWDTYESEDPLNYSHIYRDCIK